MSIAENDWTNVSCNAVQLICTMMLGDWFTDWFTAFTLFLYHLAEHGSASVPATNSEKQLQEKPIKKIDENMLKNSGLWNERIDKTSQRVLVMVTHTELPTHPMSVFRRGFFVLSEANLSKFPASIKMIFSFESKFILSITTIKFCLWKMVCSRTSSPGTG